jgi:integrase
VEIIVKYKLNDRPRDPTAIRFLKPKDKPWRVSDAGGLYLQIEPKGSMYWHYAYRFEGKQKTLSLGVYPEVSLAEAREKHREAHKQVGEKKIDPGAAKQEAKRQSSAANGNTFQDVANAFIKEKTPDWKAPTKKKYVQILTNHLFPALGERSIGDITTPELREVLRSIVELNKANTARSAKILCGQIFQHGMETGKCVTDPAAALKKRVILVPKAKGVPAVDPSEMPQLLSKIDAYEEENVKLGLQVMAATFVRTDSLRLAKWPQIDFAIKKWTVPAENLKGRKGFKDELIVPLAPQTLKLFERLRELSGESEYVFPGRKRGNPIHEKTFLFALYDLGYKGKMTTHGFRSVASTWLNDSERFSKDAIERQLDHVFGTQVHRAYNRGKYLEERQKMMVVWADQLDVWRAAGDASQKTLPLPSEIAAELEQAEGSLHTALAA